MMKLTKFRLAIVLCGLLASSAALAQARYVWIDEHGVKQFSDTPPPANVPDKNIIKQPKRGASSSSGTSTSASSSDATPAAPPATTADKEADYNKRKAAQAEKDKKAADEASKAQAKAANCESARKYLDALNSGVRMKTADKDGQPVVMDDSARAAETQRAQQSVTESCN